jgi:hypothetical protein
MIIIKKNRVTESVSQREGTWSLPAEGHELSNAKSAISELEVFKKRYYPIFGDDIMFNSVDNAIFRVRELAVNAYVINCTRKNYPKGSNPSKADVINFATALYKTAKGQLTAIGVNHLYFTQTCLRVMGLN